MSFDKEWRSFFNENARKDMPVFRMSGWTKEGFDERLSFFTSLIPDLKKQHKTALDVGCGLGSYCRLLERNGFSVTGVDVAPSVIERAKASSPKTISFQVADGYHLPFKDEAFDMVFSIGALQCLEEYKLFIKELCRVAKKTVIISTLRTTSTTSPEIQLHRLTSKDSWQTRTYNPVSFTPLFQQHGFNPELIANDEHRNLFSDAFFMRATRIELP